MSRAACRRRARGAHCRSQSPRSDKAVLIYKTRDIFKAHCELKTRIRTTRRCRRAHGRTSNLKYSTDPCGRRGLTTMGRSPVVTHYRPLALRHALLTPTVLSPVFSHPAPTSLPPQPSWPRLCNLGQAKTSLAPGHCSKADKLRVAGGHSIPNCRHVAPVALVPRPAPG